jgi:probable F420-dependent oxidoreductase
MRVGLSLPHYGFSLPEREPITFEATARWAKRAEQLGFDSVWVSDHFFYSFARYGADPTPVAALEPLATLAALATVTDRVRLGVLVLGAPFRHPAIVARAAAAIDRLSGGRLELGIGAGWMREEFDAFGYRFGEVGERFDALEDALIITSGLFAGTGPVTHDGSRHAVHQARLEPPPTQRPIPLWVGGKGGARLLRLAARYAAGWNVVWRFSDAWYRDRLAEVAAACDAVGRDPATLRRTVGLHCVLGDDEEAARAAFERGRAAMPGGALNDDPYERFRDETLSGTPKDAIARIETLVAMGVEEIVVSPWVLPFAVCEPAQVDLFASRVLPAIR